jgi:hypothetical protein
MLMRYHVGLGIGHIHLQNDNKWEQNSTIRDGEMDDADRLNDLEESAELQSQTLPLGKDASDFEGDDDICFVDDSELGMGEWDDDEFNHSSDHSSESEDWNEEAESDEERLELMDSYYTNY